MSDTPQILLEHRLKTLKLVFDSEAVDVRPET